MIKIASIMFTGLVSLLLFVGGVEVSVHVAPHWWDLGIERQVSIVVGVTLMVVVVIAGSISMTNAWIRGGYAQKNKILENKEVSLFMTHLFAWVCLDAFIYMVTFNKELEPSVTAYLIAGSGFLGPELYREIKDLRNKFKKPHGSNTH
jgi:hypothetical protein